MLESALGKVSASHFKHSQAYSISSIKQAGAFHPKIIQCFSDKEGLLTIGSGNPTYGGYSSNLEAWMSFHVKNSEDPKAYDFLKTWNYVKQLSSDIRGIVGQKLKWIEEYTPWLKEIEMPDESTMNLLGDDYLFTILDNSQNGIYVEMIKHMPSRKAKVINIHSPFFDDDLSILKSLSQSFSPEKINIFIQPELTVMNPKGLKKFNNTLAFYDINKSLGSFSEKTQRYVHAKLLEIVFENQSYFLLGSANLSKSAFGTKSFSPRNAEVSMLLHSQKRTAFFENMGLKTKKEARYSLEQIGSLVNTKSHITDTMSSDLKQNVYHIDSIDRHDNYFSVYLHHPPKHQLSLKLYDFRGIEVATLKQKKQKKHYDYYEYIFSRTNESDESVSGCLWSAKKLSNTAVVQDVVAQTKSYPNPDYRNLKIKLHSIENGEEHLWKLFNLIEPEKLIAKPSGQSQKHAKSSSDGQSKGNKDFKVISHEELQEKLKLSESQSRLFEKHFHRDNALQILSILNSVMGRAITEEDFDAIDDEEEVDIDETNGKLEKSINTEKKKIGGNIHGIGNPDSCRRYAERFFDKYLHSLEKLSEKKATASDIQILFALQAIVTDLLIYYSISSFSTSQKKNIGTLMPLVNQNTDKDFFWYGIKTVGLFYSSFLRKLLKSKSFGENSLFSQTLLNESERIAGLNSLFITCAVSALKLKSAIKGNKRNALKVCLCEFFNIMDIARLYLEPYSKKEITDHFNNIISKIKVGYKLKGKNIFKVFNAYLGIYNNMNLSKNQSTVTDLDEKRMYYHKLFGYTYLKSLPVSKITKNTTIRLALPGISWDKEYEDYISEKEFQAVSIPIYHTQIELNAIKMEMH